MTPTTWRIPLFGRVCHSNNNPYQMQITKTKPSQQCPCKMRCHASTIFILIIFFFVVITLLISSHNRKSCSSQQYGDQNDDSKVVRNPDTGMKSDCECRSSSGKIYNFCYRSPENPNQRGKRFNCKFVDEWERLETRSKKLIDEEVDKVPDPVFVTALSDKYISNGKRLISKIRRKGSKQKIVVYNMGINEDDLEVLKAACNVEVRNFNFSAYPCYFSNLKEYRWKPIVIAESLADFGAIWYADTSVVFDKINLTHVYDLMNCKKTDKYSNPDLRTSKPTECLRSRYMLNDPTGHGIYSTTNPEVYKYFPINQTKIKKPTVGEYGAGFVYAINSEKNQQNLLKWYVLCALEENCMAPEGSYLSCSFGKSDRFSEYANCHRFDQSIINILLTNEYDYNPKYYTSGISDFYRIVRSSSVEPDDFFSCLS